MIQRAGGDTRKAISIAASSAKPLASAIRHHRARKNAIHVNAVREAAIGEPAGEKISAHLALMRTA